jgi:hypothetical protein
MIFVLQVLKCFQSELVVESCFLDLTQGQTQNPGMVSGKTLGCVVVLLGALERQMLMVEVLMWKVEVEVT